MNSAIISDLFRDRGIHMEKKISNYETMKNDMADVFLKYDQNAMIQKFNTISIFVLYAGNTA